MIHNSGLINNLDAVIVTDSTATTTPTATPTATITGTLTVSVTPGTTPIPTETPPPPLQSAEYIYDGDGNMVKGVVNGVETYYPGRHYNEEVDGSTSTVKKFYTMGSVRQIADGNAPVNIVLAQSYTPYGEVLESYGTGASEYAFTGEMHDPQTGLVFLRARYYAPANGRFISKDPWKGEEISPRSYNHWLYVNNPVLMSDPSGKCLDEDQDGICDFVRKLPNIDQYNEKVPPLGITWTPSISPISTTLIRHYSTGELVEPGTNKSQYDILYGNYGLCGMIAATSIFNIDYPTIEANDVVEEFSKVMRSGGNPHYTEAWEFPLYAEKSIFSNWSANYEFRSSSLELAKGQHHWYDSAENMFAQKLKNWVQSPNVALIAGVWITTGQDMSGKVHPTGGSKDAYAQHWVVVTGVSREWEYREDLVNSPRNWVRIYNPFDNVEEYYPWKDFLSSWKNDGNMMIKFTRRDWSELHSVRE